MAKKSNKARSDGRVAVQVYIGKDENGKRKYKTVYGKTQKDAQKKANELKAKIGKGLDVESDARFSTWADLWLSSITYTKSSLQKKAYEYRVGYFKNRLQNTEITKIKLYQLQNIINEFAQYTENTKKPPSKKTVLEYIGTLKQIYAYAVLNRVIDYNVASGLMLPKNLSKNNRRALTPDEQNWIRNTPHRGQLPAMIAMLAGLRRGEITALLWSDVDFSSKTIAVNKSYNFKERRIKSPKTAAGVRTVPMPDELAAFLSAQPKSSIYVVPNTQGGLMSESSWEKLWESYLSELNRVNGNYGNIKDGEDIPFVIERFTLHYLRHTYATLLYDAGVDVLTAKHILGHEDVQTTLGIYTHLSQEKQQHDIRKLNDFLLQKNINASHMQVSNS